MFKYLVFLVFIPLLVAPRTCSETGSVYSDETVDVNYYNPNYVIRLYPALEIQTENGELCQSLIQPIPTLNRAKITSLPLILEVADMLAEISCTARPDYASTQISHERIFRFSLTDAHNKNLVQHFECTIKYIEQSPTILSAFKTTKAILRSGNWDNRDYDAVLRRVAGPKYERCAQIIDNIASSCAGPSLALTEASQNKLTTFHQLLRTLIKSEEIYRQSAGQI